MIGMAWPGTGMNGYNLLVMLLKYVTRIRRESQMMSVRYVVSSSDVVVIWIA